MWRKCKTPYCKNLHHNPSGYCDECEARHNIEYKARKIAVAGTPMETEEEVKRPTAFQRGYDRRWREFAKEYLRRHPVCAICGRPAQVVDHKDIPAQVMMDMDGRFDLDEDHYQPLCISCNLKKQKQDRAVIEDYFKMKKELNG